MTTRILLAAAVAAMFLPSTLARADNPRLVATVGRNDSFTISLRDSSGNPVTHLDAGTYDIEVHDLSETHNFRLHGPGVEQATDIGSKEDVVWTVALADGKYRFECSAHASVMNGWFTVGTVAPTPLAAAVGPKRTITVKPKIVEVGPATLTVNDRSRTDNFHLTGPGVNKKTGIAFRGRVTWNFSLQPGSYTYRSDKHKRLRGSFVVRLPA
jgi:alpha-D-ribose 1-methylphosphonate 5-triphosphate synthase subunit PhnH